MLKLKCKSLRFDGGFFVTLRMSERNEANCHKNGFGCFLRQPPGIVPMR